MAVNQCGAAAAATYYTNPAWTTSIVPVCAPTNPYTTAFYSSQSAGDVSTICNAACDAQKTSCKAYVATDLYDSANSVFQVRCFLYTTQVPQPVTCPSGPAQNTVLARYRDDVRSCFAQSVNAAVRFCSSFLQKPAPGTAFDFTATTRPTSTTTVTSVVTKSVCLGAGGRRRLVVGEEDVLPEATEHPAAPTNPAHFPEPTLAPRQNLQPRAEPAPACLDTAAFPAWNVPAACSCLSTISRLTAKAVSTAPVTTKTVTRTTTTRVNKAAIPTFQPQIVVPGKWNSDEGGGQFRLVSRIFNRAAGGTQRILVYSKDGSDTDTANVDMHISFGSEKKMFILSKTWHRLKSYGQLSLVTLGGAGEAAGPMVIGQVEPDPEDDREGAEGSGAVVGASGPNDGEFTSCSAVLQPGGEITCRMRSGEPAVFSEVLVPGEKKRYAIAVGKTAAKGAKVVRLIATAWGGAFVGCGPGERG